MISHRQVVDSGVMETKELDLPKQHDPDESMSRTSPIKYLKQD